MLEANNVSTINNYEKFTAVALTKGFALAKELSTQRIHDTNVFTRRQERHKLDARLHILTADWMRLKFQFMRNANNSFATGIGTYWRIGGIEAEYQEVVKSYQSSVSPLQELEISFRAFYHRLKL